MGTTSTVQIPYVDPANTLITFPTQDKAKADRLELLLADTGWLNLTPSSGTGTFRYRVKAGVVFISAYLSGITSVAAGSSSVILAAGILPAAYRPAINTYGPTNASGANVGLGVVQPDGGIALWNPTAGAVTVFRFTVTYSVEGKA